MRGGRLLGSEDGGERAALGRGGGVLGEEELLGELLAFVGGLAHDVLEAVLLIALLHARGLRAHPRRRDTAACGRKMISEEGEEVVGSRGVASSGERTLSKPPWHQDVRVNSREGSTSSLARL